MLLFWFDKRARKMNQGDEEGEEVCFMSSVVVGVTMVAIVAWIGRDFITYFTCSNC